MAAITVFVGSVRKGRQGRKVADWVKRNLESRGHKVHLVDPSERDMPLMVQMFKSMENPSDDLKEVQAWLAESEGFVAVTPEYNHSFSGVLKNTLDYFLEEYYTKPWAIVTYSAGGFGGLRAAEALRPVISEFGGVSVPISIQISKVQDVFDDAGHMNESRYDKSFEKMAKEFEWYVEALSKHKADAGSPY